MFTPFQKILPKAIAKLGLTREARAALVCEKYRQLAPGIIHAQALDHTRPQFLRGKALTVAITNPAWTSRLVTCKKELIEALNKSLGQELITDIKTKVVDVI